MDPRDALLWTVSVMNCDVDSTQVQEYYQPSSTDVNFTPWVHLCRTKLSWHVVIHMWRNSVRSEFNGTSSRGMHIVPVSLFLEIPEFPYAKGVLIEALTNWWSLVVGLYRVSGADVLLISVERVRPVVLRVLGVGGDDVEVVIPAVHLHAPIPASLRTTHRTLCRPRIPESMTTLSPRAECCSPGVPRHTDYHLWQWRMQRGGYKEGVQTPDIRVPNQMSG